MPWGDKTNNNNFNNSPWGSPDESPKPKHENDLGNFFKGGGDNFKKFFNNPNGNNKFIPYILAILLAVWLLTGFFVVKEGEQAVVIRFGQYTRTANTGLNYRFPTPIEAEYIEKVDLVRKEEIGFRQTSSSRSRGRTFSSIPEESHMLTGDENILDINFEVQWQISNLKSFIFNIVNQRETVRNTAESALREIVGNNSLNKIYTSERSIVEIKAKELMQKTLDLYQAGVEVTVFQMLKVDPPSKVIDAFRDVQTAKADKERSINHAKAYRNDILPKARGSAAKITEAANAYRKEITEIATGETSRFNDIYAQYLKAKEVTRNRIYFETMEKIMSGTEKVILQNMKGGVVPYLPLPDLNKTHKEK